MEYVLKKPYWACQRIGAKWECLWNDLIIYTACLKSLLT